MQQIIKLSAEELRALVQADVARQFTTHEVSVSSVEVSADGSVSCVAALSAKPRSPRAARGSKDHASKKFAVTGEERVLA